MKIFKSFLEFIFPVLKCVYYDINLTFSDFFSILEEFSVRTFISAPKNDINKSNK